MIEVLTGLVVCTLAYFAICGCGLIARKLVGERSPTATLFVDGVIFFLVCIGIIFFGVGIYSTLYFIGFAFLHWRHI